MFLVSSLAFLGPVAYLVGEVLAGGRHWGLETHLAGVVFLKQLVY